MFRAHSHLIGKNKWNVIMWMDHRAAEEAILINSTKHDVLRYVGGTMSLEMQPPKLMWLKQVTIFFSPYFLFHRLYRVQQNGM